MTHAAPLATGSPPLVEVAGVSYSYGDRAALVEVSFAVTAGSIFGLLGPNGGGKTTLFRLLATLLPVTRGTIRVDGLDLSHESAAVRRRLGVTFQSPSLDGRLTVAENLRHQGELYGLRGGPLRARIDRVAGWLGVADRLPQLVQELSGGLKRRVEIAKSLLHAPRILLLDEPSTGLDPGARLELWRMLDEIRRAESVTILVTTHLMDEAERCDRLGILDRGRLVALDAPATLRAALGGDVLTITTREPELIVARLRESVTQPPRVMGDQVRLETPEPVRVLSELMTSCADLIEAVAVAKPTLEDVFLARTGHRFWETD